MTGDRIPPQRVELSAVPVTRCEHRPAWARATSSTLAHGDLTIVVYLAACQHCDDPMLGIAETEREDAVVSWYELRGVPDVERVGE